MKKNQIQNPILPGYYPDPSICRAGDDYYLVCSSFEMTPGIPIFHSRDLAHWTQIGNAMTEENGFHIERDGGVGGIMAPTIRYHEGLFYIIDTNLSDKGNFIITAEDPAGPWSEPHWMTDVPDIDASLFFDNDGQCYIVGIGDCIDLGDGKKDRGFWLAKYDIHTFTRMSEPTVIFDSALRRGWSPEAPHIYHIGDYYYLFFAEGGTEHYHAEMCARSKDLFGFYEGCPANPVLTHRHMGYTAPIINIGHADLVQIPDGSWYAVFLGSRLVDGSHKNLGRETWLCPVVWERDWPLFTPQTGKVEWTYDAPECLPWEPIAPVDDREDFDEDRLPVYMTLWGTPAPGTVKLEDSCLKLRCVRQAPDDELIPMDLSPNTYDDRFAAFAARRQCALHVKAAAKMQFVPQGAERAGMAITQAMNHQLLAERAVEDGRSVIRLVLVTAEYDGYPFFPGFTAQTHRKVLASAPYDGEEIIISLELNRQTYTVRYGKDENALTELCVTDGRLINTELVGCMAGTQIAMFATGSGADSDNCAAFDWFSYREI